MVLALCLTTTVSEWHSCFSDAGRQMHVGGVSSADFVSGFSTADSRWWILVGRLSSLDSCRQISSEDSRRHILIGGFSSGDFRQQILVGGFLSSNSRWRILDGRFSSLDFCQWILSADSQRKIPDGRFSSVDSQRRIFIRFPSNSWQIGDVFDFKNLASKSSNCKKRLLE